MSTATDARVCQQVMNANKGNMKETKAPFSNLEISGHRDVVKEPQICQGDGIETWSHCLSQALQSCLWS